jgi:hypothetical protein
MSRGIEGGGLLGKGAGFSGASADTPLNFHQGMVKPHFLFEFSTPTGYNK